MKIDNIISFMEKWAPPEMAESFDNSGFLIGNTSNEVDSILLCLDVTAEVVEEAIEKNCNLIISHHPTIFFAIKDITTNNAQGRKLMKLISNDISVLSCHTNLDLATDGVNDTLSDLCDIDYNKETTPISITEKNYPIGKKGYLKERYSLKEYAEFLKENLDADYVRIVGDENTESNRVGVFCGSFDYTMLEFLKDVDVIVTGDLKHAASLEILANGLCAIDVGHYYSERVILPKIKEKLKEEFKDLSIHMTEVEKAPFKII